MHINNITLRVHVCVCMCECVCGVRMCVHECVCVTIICYEHLITLTLSEQAVHLSNDLLAGSTFWKRDKKPRI